MAMRAAGRFPKRAGKAFVRNLFWALVVYAPVAAFLTLWPVTPLGGVLIFGAIFLPAVAALITVAGVWAGRNTEAHDSGYHYGGYPGSGEGGWYGDGDHHHGGGDGGGGHHAGGDGGGGF